MDPKGLPLIISSAVVTGLAVAATSAPADFARTRFMTSKDPVYKRCACRDFCVFSLYSGPALMNPFYPPHHLSTAGLT